ncbi:hypothetical protein BU23DRAFT_128781 [Bimuria novae-zelandiae CBS 107.79]|uniref:Uncharacterized protein n=1 Tax=Bimuria novae-zelandiae CBS 107.79 TaxID=1447943 RepID=A0A6A5VBH5_9PLEO|nr:hypothetical protein BU23DRAFT_128781 [Bimuria novae-zelandiae CBS 107.79]
MALYSSSPQMRTVSPATPVHSPHHSVHSSSSSRLSVRNLTLHEYRKQLNSPASQATPPGKTLRRKAAASGLKEIERVPSVSGAPPGPTTRAPPHPLHISQSTQSLYTYQRLPPSPPHQQHDLSVDELFRSQSAEPSAQYNTTGSVRKFKPIKRLPKPLSSTGHRPLPPAPAPVAPVTSNQTRLSPLRTTSFPSFEDSDLRDSQPTPSTFSLSRFPRPPNLVDPSHSPSSDGNGPRVNTTSFASTAPATPPATPAVIHYRGTSFDLVNPHNSLVLDNIVTPSRDLDSSDYLPLRSSEDPLDLSEMAPKRPLYGDLSSAYASIITRRGDDMPAPLNVNLPLPPTPVAHSPGSSAFDSPLQSPEPLAAIFPSTNRKAAANESRFSLKQLTRSLTQRFSKTPEKPHEEELREFSDSRVSLASATFEGEFPRPLERSYRAVSPRSATLPDEPVTPVSPLDQAVHLMSQRSSPPSVEMPRFSTQRVFSAPLSSMLPDSPSTQLGRAGEERPYASESEFTTRPYYDDAASIYPSSSIYTSDSRRQSKTAQIRSTNRKSNPYYWRMSGGTDAIAAAYKSDAVPQYLVSQRASCQVSQPPQQAVLHLSLQPEIEKTDSLSRLIDQYKSTDGSSVSQPLLDENKTGNADVAGSLANIPEHAAPTERPDITRITSGLSQFDLNVARSEIDSKEDTPLLPSEVEGAGRSKLAPPPGLPPSMPAPLAPPFEYDEILDSPKRSELSSNSPSYGDTRALLQFSRPDIEERAPMHSGLKSSSSYSQPGASAGPYTPRQALEQAEKIFAKAASQQQAESIPAMWSKRISSHNLLRKGDNDLDEEQDRDESSILAGYEDEVERADWETVGNGSPHRAMRASVGESLADYSSSEGSHISRDSMGFSGPFPVYDEPPLEPGAFDYQHPTPLRSHSNPFTSSPPALSGDYSMHRIADESYQSPVQSSPPAHSNTPTFYRSSPDVYTPGSPQQEHFPCSPPDMSFPTSPRQEHFPFAPWAEPRPRADPYALSDKETQELLASGPNDEILYEHEEEEAGQNDSFQSQDISSPMQPMRITIPTATTMERSSSPTPRENSFEKLTVIGPKGNLTGTPHGTNMHEAGSSIADNSSPGALLDSSPLVSSINGHRNSRSAAAREGKTYREASDYFTQSKTRNVSHGGSAVFELPGRKGSVTRIVPRIHTPPPGRQERSPSQATLHSQASSFANPNPRAKRLSLRSSIAPRDSRRRGSRAAVPGQTKLRQMVLAPSPQLLLSSDNSNNDSRLFGTEHSVRPSTSNTHSPLRPRPSRPTLRTVLANQHSPHLLCPEQAIDPEEEVVRRKLSWVIFAIFCILPPVLILYRWMGDLVIVNVTNGRFSHVAPKPKQIALGAGIAVNVSIVLAITLPIVIARAAGSL